MSCRDAEMYVNSVGIPTPECPTAPTMPQFQMVMVGYDDGLENKESRAKHLNGSCFQFEVDDDKFLQKAPTVRMACRDKKSTLLMIDPDAPDRVAAETAGEFGPWLHWLVTDCDEDAQGTVRCPYMGPAPPKGKHRYIFIEFEQTGEVKVASIERKQWDIKGFLADNKDVLRAVALNYYYCSFNREAAAGPPCAPRKNGTSCDKEWYPSNPKGPLWDSPNF